MGIKIKNQLFRYFLVSDQRVVANDEEKLIYTSKKLTDQN